MKKKIRESLSKAWEQLVENWLEVVSKYHEFTNSPTGKKFIIFLWTILKLTAKTLFVYFLKKVLSIIFE